MFLYADIRNSRHTLAYKWCLKCHFHKKSFTQVSLTHPFSNQILTILYTATSILHQVNIRIFFKDAITELLAIYADHHQ